MEPTFSLAYLTAGPADPLEVINIAADLGYAQVGLRALPAAPGGDTSAFLSDPALVRATKAQLRETGVTVFDMEIIRIGPAFDVTATHRFLDLCGELGARAILVAGDDPDETRFTAHYAAFCAAAAPYGLSADLEFMPWTCVKDARTATRIVAATGAPNAGVLVDALHAGRSTTTTVDIAAIPRAALHYAQICDGPSGIPATDAELIHDARCARLAPGEGGIALVPMFAALPHDLPISIEVPNEALRARHGLREWARINLEAAKTVMTAAWAR